MNHIGPNFDTLGSFACILSSIFDQKWAFESISRNFCVLCRSVLCGIRPEKSVCVWEPSYFEKHTNTENVTFYLKLVPIFVILMAEAFMGYLLPWGQMSYWGAQVIISLFGAIPYVGDDLTLWIRGDYVVSGATLNRFFAFSLFYPED